MVTAIAGNQADIGIALQSAQGVAAAAAQHRLYLTGGGLAPVKETADIEETTADRLRSAAYVQRVSAAGGPAFVVRPNAIGMFLYGAMGAKAVTGAGDPYSHEFTLASVLPYFTMWRRLGPVAAGGLYEKFIDCKIAQLAFASQAGGLLIATATIMGINSQSKDAAEVTVTVEDSSAGAFIHADGEGQLQIEGSPVASIESFGLTINNNATNQQGDSVSGYAINEGLLGIEATTTLLVEDFELWNRYIYGAANPTDGDGPSRDILELTGGIDYKFERPGTPERSLQFELPRVEAIPATLEPNVNGDVLKYALTLRAKKPASGSGLTATLLNGLASYAAA